MVVFPSENFGRDIVRGPRFRRENLIRLKLTRQSEINDLQQVVVDGVLCHEKEILGLEVSMTDMRLMHVVDGTNDLLHENSCMNLGKGPRLNDAIKELSAGTKLHDEIDVKMVLECLVQLDDVWVIHDFHQSNLLLKTIDICHSGLWNRLHSSNTICGFVLRFAHRTVRTNTDLLLLHVVKVVDFPRVVDNEPDRIRILLWPLHISWPANSVYPGN